MLHPGPGGRVFGDLDGAIRRLIDPRTMAEVKTIFGQYDAARAIQERAALNADIARAVTAVITGPVNIISVQIENIDFSEAYEQSVEKWDGKLPSTMVPSSALPFVNLQPTPRSGN